MNLQQMKCVVTVAECGSFSQAAKRLFLSQPSISALIKDLETELGITIFDRNNRGITMTMAGSQLLKYAQQMLECEESIRESFLTDVLTRPYVLSVAAQHYPFVKTAYVRMIREMNAAQYRFRLQETATASILTGVASRLDDIGILSISRAGEKRMLRTLKNNGLQYKVLFSGLPHVFMSRTHPLAGRNSVARQELDPYPCIIYEQKDNVLFPYAEETSLLPWTAERILQISDLYTSGFFMLELNAYNIGTGLLPKELDRQLAAPLLEGGDPYTVGYIMPKGMPLSPVGQTFLDLLRETLRDEYGVDSECKKNERRIE